MSRQASRSGCRSNQKAAAKWAACVHSALGNERSSRHRPMRSTAASESKQSMFELLSGNASGEAQSTPPGWRGCDRTSLRFQAVGLGRAQAPPVYEALFWLLAAGSADHRLQSKEVLAEDQLIRDVADRHRCSNRVAAARAWCNVPQSPSGPPDEDSEVGPDDPSWPGRHLRRGKS